MLFPPDYPGQKAGESQGCAGGGLGCVLSFVLLLGIGLLLGWLSDRIPAFGSRMPFVASAALLYSGLGSAMYFALRRRQPALARGTGFGLLIGIALTLGIAAIFGPMDQHHP